jgi:hypothetical protein
MIMYFIIYRLPHAARLDQKTHGHDDVAATDHLRVRLIVQAGVIGSACVAKRSKEKSR